MNALPTRPLYGPAPIPGKRWRTGRTGPVRLIVIHTTEGHEDLASLERFFAQPGTIGDPPYGSGYHAACDHRRAVSFLGAEHSAYGAGGVNGYGQHYSFCGKAATIDWPKLLTSAGGTAMIDAIRADAEALGIPLRKLTPKEMQAGQWGIVGHADVSAVHSASGGHTDPGGRFPWPMFLDLLNQEGSPVQRQYVKDKDHDEVYELVVARKHVTAEEMDKRGDWHLIRMVEPSLITDLPAVS